MDKITYDEYLALGNEEKLGYIMAVLELESAEVYGRVVNEEKKTLFVAPCTREGQRGILLNQSRKWGIPAAKEEFLKEGDYVRGRLVLNPRGPYVEELERMESFEEFREKLAALMKAKWKREGFTFGSGDIVPYDGKTIFSQWVSEKVEAMLEEKYEAYIHGAIEAGEQELHGLQSEVSHVRSELEGMKKAKEQEGAALNRLEQANEKALKIYQHYKELGIITDTQEAQEDKEEYPYDTYEGLAEEVWAYLWKKKNLYYKKSTVRYFMNALRTQQLIMLWGRPGTGKTSLPRGVAEAIGAKCVRVQVQSNWTDNQDLLGFYNMIDQRYVSTQFMDALVEAAEHPEQLYIILLDEMNLSNVEYYFSEMLNVFTWDEPYTLHLYSKRFRENAGKALKEAEAQGGEISGLIDLLADMDRYKPEFTIPGNVRFVGTLNTDETTKTISPKVVDRSCLIELQAISGYDKEAEREALPEEVSLDGKRVVVSAATFEVKRLPVGEVREIKQMLEQIQEILGNAGIFLSNRTSSYVDQWKGWEDSCVEPDEVVLEKILPMINLADNKGNRDVLGRLKEEILGPEAYHCEKSRDKLERMLGQAGERRRIVYWES